MRRLENFDIRVEFHPQMPPCASGGQSGTEWRGTSSSVNPRRWAVSTRYTATFGPSRRPWSDSAGRGGRRTAGYRGCSPVAPDRAGYGPRLEGSSYPSHRSRSDRSPPSAGHDRRQSSNRTQPQVLARPKLGDRLSALRGEAHERTSRARTSRPPSEVHERLARHLLTDGYRLVLDAERSHGSLLVDARDGREYLDLYAHFASAPLGANPPGIVDDPAFMAICSPGSRSASRRNWTCTRPTSRSSSKPSPGCSAIRRCRTCSSWRAAHWRSRTR